MRRPRDRSSLTIAAGAAALMLVVLVVASRASATVPREAVTAAAAATLVLALTASAWRVDAAWRGPTPRPFPRDEAVCCTPAEAAVVRAAAQLRGTLGGAGHVRRGRVALHALAWIAPAALGLEVLVDARDGVLLAWAGMAAALWAAGAIFPALPFYYREANGGGVIVHPPDAWEHLVRLRPQLRALAAGAGAPSQPPVDRSAPGWGTSLTSAQDGANGATQNIDRAL